MTYLINSTHEIQALSFISACLKFKSTSSEDITKAELQTSCPVCESTKITEEQLKEMEEIREKINVNHSKKIKK
jgi:hypothetical protein